MKTVLYLIQTAAGMPKIYQCLKAKPHLLLSYKEKTADTTLYAPNTTWTQGRNRLYQYVKDKNLLYDYYVFMDEDVAFQKVALIPNFLYRHRLLKSIYDSSISLENQAVGFKHLEELLEVGDYPIVTMSYHVYKSYTPPMDYKEVENLKWAVNKGVQNLK